MNTAGHYDFVIVGGGIAGASIAYELSRSATCLLLEQEQAFGYHTTGRSAATYIELLHHQAIVTLSRRSLDFLTNPPPQFSVVPLVHDCGCMLVGKASERQQLEAAYRQAQTLGTQVQRLDAEQLLEKVPVLRVGSEGFCSGLFETEAKRLDVDALLQGYLKGVRAQGSKTLVNMGVDAITWDGNRWHIRCKGQDHRADVLINAAGAWSDQIATMAGIPMIGLEPKMRTMITFDLPSGINTTAWPMVGDLQQSFYFLPEAGRLLGSAADETPAPPSDIQADELAVATAAYNIEQHTQLKINRIHHKWAGLRTFAPDRLPVIGYEPDHPGFFWFAGQGGFGIQTAPAAAQLGRALALNESLPPSDGVMALDYKKISPARFR